MADGQTASSSRTPTEPTRATQGVGSVNPGNQNANDPPAAAAGGLNEQNQLLLQHVAGMIQNAVNQLAEAGDDRRGHPTHDDAEELGHEDEDLEHADDDHDYGGDDMDHEGGGPSDHGSDGGGHGSGGHGSGPGGDGGGHGHGGGRGGHGGGGHGPGGGGGGPGGGGPAPRRDEDRRRADRVSFKTFKACGATEFSGTVDPMAAFTWVNNMEKVFEISHCAEADYVTYAAAMFTEDALDWWITTGEILGREQRRAMTWEAFVQRFYEQYCPPDLQRQYLIEFLELKQGDLTVAAYEKQYIRKARFARRYLVDEKERSDRFIEGLREEIREFVELHKVESLANAVELARRREQTLTRRGTRDADLMPPPRRPFRDNRQRSSPYSRPSRPAASSRSNSRGYHSARSHSGTQA